MGMTSKNGKLWFALFAAFCFVAGCVFRALYLYQFATSPLCSVPLGPDVAEYYSWAKRIVAGEMLWTGVHIHSPLYPYFLAALTSLFAGPAGSVINIRAAQLLLGLLAAIPLAAAIAIAVRSRGDEEKRGWSVTLPIFLVLWAWYPPLIYYMGELTSEVLLVPLLGVAVFFLYRWEDRRDGHRSILNLGLAGLVLGLAVVTHPIAAFFLLVEAVYLGVVGVKNLRGATKDSEEGEREVEETARGGKFDSVPALLAPLAIFILMASLPILFVASRNVLILGGPPLQANSGFNIYLGNGPGSDGTCRLRPGPEWDDFHAKAESEASKIGVSKDRYLLGETFEWVASHPARWLSLLGRKALYFWNRREIAAGADVHPLFYFTPFQQAFPWAFGLCATLALMALFYHIGDADFIWRYRHFMIWVLAFFLAQALLVASGRYRVGAIPAILVLAAAGVDTILRAIVYPERRYLGLLPAAALAWIIVFLPSPPFNERRESGEACTLMGEALLKSGDAINAEKCLQGAIAVQPTWSRNYNLLGMAMEKLGKDIFAKLAYLKAVKLAPEDPEGYVNLATICGREGDLKHASELYRKALSLERPSVSLYYNYALFLSGKKDLRGAEKYYQLALTLNPVDPKILNNLAVVKIQLGRPEEAVDLLEKAVRLEPNNQGRLLNLTMALLISGREEEARKVAKHLDERQRRFVGIGGAESGKAGTDSVPESEPRHPRKKVGGDKLDSDSDSRGEVDAEQGALSVSAPSSEELP